MFNGGYRSIPRIFGCKHLCLRQCNASCNAKEFVRIVMNFIGLWEAFGIHLDIILEKERICSKVILGSQTSTVCLWIPIPIWTFFHKMTLLLPMYLQVFFHSALLRSSWSFYAQAPRKWSRKDVKKDTLL